MTNENKLEMKASLFFTLDEIKSSLPKNRKAKTANKLFVKCKAIETTIELLLYAANPK